jgi:DNA-binding MarR family transcriptional regulator
MESVVCAEEWFRRRFGEFLRSPSVNVTLSARLVYTVLLLHMDPTHECCWPSLTTLSKESRFPRRTVTRALAELERHGLITRHKAPGFGTVYSLPGGRNGR